MGKKCKCKVKDSHLVNTTVCVVCVIHVSSQFRRRFCLFFNFRYLLLLLVLCEGHSSRMLNRCMGVLLFSSSLIGLFPFQ